MADRESVMAGLKWIADTKNDAVCEGLKCSKIAEDALELLKEQEEETAFILSKYYEPMCEKCGFRPFVGYIPRIEWMKQHGYKRCPHCGRKVKWI